MNYKLLSVSTEEQVNIGDYIQALASKQFLPHLDGFIQREELKGYNEEECKVIMNGWYMHHPYNWPPSNKIIPLFVAFHINSLAKQQLLSDENINYLKKHEPIGCRDISTRNLLLEKGVKAYFSACMTLTLGYSYKSNNKENKCYFVDPYTLHKQDIFHKIHNIIYLLSHWKAISVIANKLPGKSSSLRKKIQASYFYKQYIIFFTQETLLKAEYISQQNKEYKTDFRNEYERLEAAEKLIKKYARAKLVVTSRIHCALPCIGLGVPVLYTENTKQSEASSCRLGGLKELFNTISINENGYKTNFEFNKEKKISINSAPLNRESWIEYAKDLITTCKKFTSNGYQ